MPGSVSVRWVRPGAAPPDGALSHQLDPAGLAGLARALWGSAPPIAVVGVGAGSLGVGEGLSPAVEAAVARAADVVAGLARGSRRA
jgi:hydrogenase maturation protease